ncbi:MAG: four helix bundle protein [Pyrinomonadaceae bacterium]|nr:four helix bundle protein [Pyrinomonadaceae bacterium]
MSEELKKRSRDFAIRVIRLSSSLPKTVEAQVVGKQIVRSGTSVGAHYREAQYAKSDADFISKIQGALQELEETIYWLEIIDEMEFFPAHQFAPLNAEANELRAIFITIAKKVRTRSA